MCLFLERLLKENFFYAAQSIDDAYWQVLVIDWISALLDEVERVGGCADDKAVPRAAARSRRLKWPIWNTSDVPNVIIFWLSNSSPAIELLPLAAIGGADSKQLWDDVKHHS
jgi:hypothetical protein